jgi:hypothetical protein
MYFVGFILFSEETAIISLLSINQFILLMEKCVFFELETVFKYYVDELRASKG